LLMIEKSFCRTCALTYTINCFDLNNCWRSFPM